MKYFKVFKHILCKKKKQNPSFLRNTITHVFPDVCGLQRALRDKDIKTPLVAASALLLIILSTS
jgi:hypothetical protein